jgi:transmembrane protein
VIVDMKALCTLDTPPASAIARILLTAPFWWSGLSKLFDFTGAVAEADHFGLHPAPLAAVAVILVQLGGSALVVFGRHVWIGAGALAVFTVLANLVGHPFWTLADPMARFHDMNAFLANIGLIGGLGLAAILDDRRHE